MSDQSLPEGAFLTTLNGKRCTAVPRANADVPPTPTPTPEPTPPPPAASNSESADAGEEDGGEDGSVEAPVVAGPEETSNAGEEATDGAAAGTTTSFPESEPTPEAEEATDGAAASTTVSFPESESTPEVEGSSRAQAEEEDALEETQVRAEDTPSSTFPPPAPPPPPPQSSPVEASTEVIQQEPSASPPASPSASPSSDPPQIPQTSQTSQPPEPSETPQTPLPTPEDSLADTSAAPTTSPTEEGDADDQEEEPVPTSATPEDDESPDETLVETPDTTPDTTSTDPNGAAAENDPTPTPTPAGISDSSANKPRTAVVAGSVAGSVALVAIIAFLLWFWRKKAISRRRSSLLTPLTIAPGKRGTSEKPYIIDRGSVGPTPKGEKFRAAVGANFRRLRSKVSGARGSADLGRAGDVTGRDRLRGWWESRTADAGFGWNLRNEGVGVPDPAAARDMRERRTAGGSQPDFLTLLGMDDDEVRRGASRGHGGRAGSGSSGEHFLDGLGLNFGSSAGGGGREDPFSDDKALTRESAKPAPLAVSSTLANPFSDENTSRPSSYVADTWRSRGRSSKGAGIPSLYRDSLQSEVEPRRPKFRSDPFDLERPSLLGGGQNLTMSGAAEGTGTGLEGVGKPRRAHTREDSFSSSKYSSGVVSLGDWSDPGPDVGPAGAAARGGAGAGARESSGGASVGKAL